MHTLEEMCERAAGETGGRLQSEKFSVNLHLHCFGCDLGAVAVAQFHPAAQSLPWDSRKGFCVGAKCSYAQSKSEEEILAPVSSHPSFSLDLFLYSHLAGLSGSRPGLVTDPIVWRGIGNEIVCSTFSRTPPRWRPKETS